MLICIAAFFTRNAELADVPGAEIDGVSVVAAWRHLQAIFNDRKVVPVVDIEYLKHSLGDQVSALPSLYPRPSASALLPSTSPPSPPPPRSHRRSTRPSTKCPSSNSSPTSPRASAEKAAPLATRRESGRNASPGESRLAGSDARQHGRPTTTRRKSGPFRTSARGRFRVSSLHHQFQKPEDEASVAVDAVATPLRPFAPLSQATPLRSPKTPLNPLLLLASPPEDVTLLQSPSLLLLTSPLRFSPFRSPLSLRETRQSPDISLPQHFGPPETTFLENSDPKEGTVTIDLPPLPLLPKYMVPEHSEPKQEDT